MLSLTSTIGRDAAVCGHAKLLHLVGGVRAIAVAVVIQPATNAIEPIPIGCRAKENETQPGVVDLRGLCLTNLILGVWVSVRVTSDPQVVVRLQAGKLRRHVNRRVDSVRHP